MFKNLLIPFAVILCASISAGESFGFGEDILAQSGQYTFFIKPQPGTCTTYYQKMVPCIVEETVPVIRKTTQRYPLPVPITQRIPLTISEVPVGCAEGAGPCSKCTPLPTCRSGFKEVVVPANIPVPVPDIQVVPKTVKRKVMLPQWFAVTEQPKPPKMVRKVRN